MIERIDLTEIEVNQKRLELDLPPKLRLYFEKLKGLARGSLIFGPRGVGKTTFLLHQCRQNKFLYVPADLPIVARYPLWNIANQAFLQGYEGIVFDEIHYAKDWSLHLKSVYDSFPKKVVYASDSSSIVLRSGVADLSRRFVRNYIPLLSFREFIYLKTGVLNPEINPFGAKDNIIKKVLDSANILSLFKEYVTKGIRPYFLEDHYEQRTLNIIEKTISDVPFFVPQVTENHVRLLNAVVGYLSAASIPTLNIESLTSEWEIGKEKLYNLLFVMEQMHLIRIIRRQGDKKRLTKGAKIFLHDPSFYAVLGGDIGNLRESFAVAMFGELGKSVFAAKDETRADYIVDGNLAIEIGGKNKKAKNADFVIRDDIEVPAKKAIPLWLLGMRY